LRHYSVVDVHDRLSFREFANLMTMSEVDLLKMKQNVDLLKVNGLVNVEPSHEVGRCRLTLSNRL
jgi:hypothetical protein